MPIASTMLCGFPGVISASSPHPASYTLGVCVRSKPMLPQCACVCGIHNGAIAGATIATRMLDNMDTTARDNIVVSVAVSMYASMCHSIVVSMVATVAANYSVSCAPTTCVQTLMAACNTVCAEEWLHDVFIIRCNQCDCHCG